MQSSERHVAAALRSGCGILVAACFQNCTAAQVGHLKCTCLQPQGAAVGLAEEADLEELIRQKEALVAERDGQVQAIVALRSEVRVAEGRCRCHGVRR